MDLLQKVEDVVTAMSETTPVTSKREIKTNIIANDGQTIILGGLLKDVEKKGRSEIPGLSQIPLIGNLFTSITKQKENVDLMVFITPEIINTPEEAYAYTNSMALRSDATINDNTNQKLENLTLDAMKKELSDSERKIQKRLELEYNKIKP